MKPKVFAWAMCVWGLGGGVISVILAHPQVMKWVGIALSMLVGITGALMLLLAEKHLSKYSPERQEYRFHSLWYGIAIALSILAMVLGLSWQASFAMGGFFGMLAIACMLWEHRSSRELLWKDFRSE